MDIKRIEGATRTLGAPHEWDENNIGPCYGLPIRDVTVGGVPFMISAWELSPVEIEQLLRGENLKLWIQGTSHPVVSLSVGPIEMRGSDD